MACQGDSPTHRLITATSAKSAVLRAVLPEHAAAEDRANRQRLMRVGSAVDHPPAEIHPFGRALLDSVQWRVAAERRAGGNASIVNITG